jgi:hypothetical protein
MINGLQLWSLTDKALYFYFNPSSCYQLTIALTNTFKEFRVCTVHIFKLQIHYFKLYDNGFIG